MSVILNNVKGIKIFLPVDLNHVFNKSLGIQCHFYKLDGIGVQQEELEGFWLETSYFILYEY